MFRVQQQVVFCRLDQLGILLIQILLQSMAQVIPLAGIRKMLHRVGSGSHSVGPPVGEVSPVDRAVLKLVPDGGIQFLERNHAQLEFLPIAPVQFLDHPENLRFRRGVVAEDTGER